MNFALLVLTSGVFLPFKVSAILDSAGVQKDGVVKVECRAPLMVCNEVVLDLYESGYTVSRNTGLHDLVVGPLRNEGDSAVLYTEFDGRQDSVKFEIKDESFSSLQRENVTRKGFLSSLVFLVVGYLLFFVIR